MRDLVRLRSQAMRDLRKARQQLLSFLLRHGRNSPYGHWTKMHRRWLGELVFAHPAQHLALEEMLQQIERAEALCERLKRGDPRIGAAMVAGGGGAGNPGAARRVADRGR